MECTQERHARLYYAVLLYDCSMLCCCLVRTARRCRLKRTAKIFRSEGGGTTCGVRLDSCPRNKGRMLSLFLAHVERLEQAVSSAAVPRVAISAHHHSLHGVNLPVHNECRGRPAANKNTPTKFSSRFFFPPRCAVLTFSAGPYIITGLPRESKNMSKIALLVGQGRKVG